MKAHKQAKVKVCMLINFRKKLYLDKNILYNVSFEYVGKH